MVLLHIAHIETAVVGGVNIAVPKMVNAQMKFADVGIINLAGESVGLAPTFSLEEFWNKKLPEIFKKPDLVVFHEVYRPAFLKLGRFFLANNIPYIVIPHGCMTKTAQQKKFLKKWTANLLLFRKFLKNAAAIQYLSHREQEQSAFCYPSLVLPNGISVPDTPKRQAANQNIRLLYIGRLEIGIKGFDLMLDAIRMQKDLMRKSGATLIIHGPNDDPCRKELQIMAETYGISDLVALRGEVWGEEKKQAFLNADYFIQTSRSEGMPLGILEAMAHGLPVIVTEGTGFADLVSENHCGFGCKTDARGIALAIENAITKTDDYTTLSQQARDFTKEHYEEQTVAEKTVCSYGKLLS